ncbi:hypothetical protein [Breznakia pachnodae]|uniref:2-iminoacetate synthase ThiH n=1 Tax=Breznakia pachnodae TaxID=265178 RepID=A0ABU0E4V7_9FIRM|nr:hypothetical protein [Breznakia pachnodae]MDQ0361535.1 2-iminoacetate synthase ThiH [Breznakia pachnodae]
MDKVSDKPYKETFVPLYISNECDSVCKICNLRKNNNKIIRKTATKEEIYDQLNIIYSIEKISAVCILTGEHITGRKRRDNLDLVIWSINLAIQIGFKKVYFNIGALTDDEIIYIRRNVIKTEVLILSLFQETYSRSSYKKFFSNSFIKNSPKEDFDFRYKTCEKWIDHGFESVDIGILVGLNDLEEDFKSLIIHAEKLKSKGANIYISLPRVIGNSENFKLIKNENYIKLIKNMKSKCPWAKIIMTSREDVNLIKKVLEYIDIISPGCSDVVPYRKEGKIINSELTSQFVVSKIRDRPSEFLNNFEIDFCYYKNN